jgi:cysteine synthase A
VTTHRRTVTTVVTPTVPFADPDTGTTLWLKLEYCQPSGSIKDRFVAHVLDRALAEGALPAGGEVAEASSGSTAIALAVACARAGVAFRAFLPEGVSGERLRMLAALGAAVTLTPAVLGMAGAQDACERFGAGAPGAFLPRQFTNPANADAHREVTGPELAAQVGAPVDAFVAGVGTGGTLVGIGAALRERHQGTVVARALPVAGGGLDGDPEVCSGVPGVVEGMSGLLGGLDGGFETVEVPWPEAVTASRDLCRAGFPAGLSSGLNVAAARRISRVLRPGAVVATVLCDRMERYFSSPLFACPPPGG